MCTHFSSIIIIIHLLDSFFGDRILHMHDLGTHFLYSTMFTAALNTPEQFHYSTQGLLENNY